MYSNTKCTYKKYCNNDEMNNLYNIYIYERYKSLKDSDKKEYDLQLLPIRDIF